MSPSPELLAEYEEASKPFIGGCITAEHTRLKAWRYFLEINSGCNLRCPTCTKGNVEGYEHKTGFMDMELMENILDKIKSENPEAIVFLYGNSEPFLHPKLPECITAVKRRGLNAQISTNMNHLQRVDEMLDAGPDYIIISLSGFTQEVYVKGHAGGNIEKVLANMKIMADANYARAPEKRVNIAVNYHIYNDNQHEVPLMKEYAKNCGFGFFTSVARAISMENAIQYCRHHDPDAIPFDVQEGRPDWNHAMPPIGETYKKAMDRLLIPPTKAREMYKDVPEVKNCPIGWMFSFIRHDGKISSCACVADRRITLGNYLEKSQDELTVERRDHSICQQCQRYKLSHYFHLGGPYWTPPV
jgi:MoaA/NifB/PqqE/SkfB family radical SAM enzyme